MELTDLQIQNAIKRKDESVYEYIIKKYGRQVYYIASSIMNGCGGKEDIEECVSDAFYKAWVTINSYDPQKGSFKTWLLIVTKYIALEYRRRLLKTGSVSMDVESAQHEASAEECVIGRVQQENIIGVINSFGGVDRELFIRRYFCGERINELANSFNLSRSAVDNRLLRGRKKIREALSNE